MGTVGRTPPRFSEAKCPPRNPALRPWGPESAALRQHCVPCYVPYDPVCEAWHDEGDLHSAKKVGKQDAFGSHHHTDTEQKALFLHPRIRTDSGLTGLMGWLSNAPLLKTRGPQGAERSTSKINGKAQCLSPSPTAPEAPIVTTNKGVAVTKARPSLGASLSSV